ncbi:MAG: leucyl aminopeptidase, partial [Pseudomonadota bacterium]
VFEDKTLPAATAEADTAAGGAIRRLVEAGDVTGKPGSIARLFHLPGVKAPRILLTGLGEPHKFDAARYHKACLEAAKALASGPVRRAANFVPEVDLEGRGAAWRARQAAVAADSACYRYTATVKARNGAGLEEMLLPAAGGEAALAQARAIAAGVALARELGNLPPNICNPAYLADTARRIAADEAGVMLEVIEREELQRMGMGALLAVAQGSANPPRLLVLRWQGAGPVDKPYVLVGKGITFDTGGVNLKVQGGIEEMKYDMCGAATVIGAFLSAVRMKLPLNVVAVVPAVENMPDGNSYRPSDVLTSRAGSPIEVGNTDAEGRLILCDALTYARRFEPAAMVDVATLTGACVIALGKHAHGLMSRHDDLAEELLGAGQAALDRAWRLPLWDDYQQQLESAFADVYNIGGKGAGAITAGCFLARFAEGQRWAHLDIAGTAWDEGRKGMATGRPVPLLAQWLLDRSG